MSEQQGQAAAQPNPPPPSTTKLDHFLKVYSTFRDYTKQEDALILGRLNSVLTIHGFLYAAYGFTIQKQLETAEKLTELFFNRTPDIASCIASTKSINTAMRQNDLFIECVALVGFSISVLGIISIFTATRAAGKLRKIFDGQFVSSIGRRYKVNNTIRLDEPPYAVFPSITGGGSKLVEFFSYFTPLGVPFILALSWIVSLWWLFSNKDIGLFIFLKGASPESASCAILSNVTVVRLH